MRDPAVAAEELEANCVLKWIALWRVERVKFDSTRHLVAVRPNSPDKATDRAMQAGFRGPKAGKFRVA